MANKCLMDFSVVENRKTGNGYSLLKLRPKEGVMPEIGGGQFVNIEVRNSKNTFLRRPISVNNVDYENNLLWLLIKEAGEGTRCLCGSKEGDLLNILLPLGNGFGFPKDKGSKLLLIGGGVGIAPMLYWGKLLKSQGYSPRFLLGGRSSSDLLELDEFGKLGELYVSTEDGSMGEKGFVTVHSVMNSDVDKVYCCGPLPMMKAVAGICKSRGCDCEVSLENKMACGLGACLCCVEDTQEGHVCVCTSGPVFNVNELKW